MDPVMLAATVKSLRSVPTLNCMLTSRIGAVSLAHFMPSGFSQSKLLFHCHSLTLVSLLSEKIKLSIGKFEKQPPRARARAYSILLENILYTVRYQADIN